MAEPEKKKKRKRGGLAGLWDRNKNIIKPLASAAAGILGGPALAAGVGAAMGGLDRPGKGGIGLDVGGAVRGGLSGYGAGALGAGLAGGVRGAMQAGGSNLEQFFTGARGGMGQYSGGGRMGAGPVRDTALEAQMGVGRPVASAMAPTPTGASTSRLGQMFGGAQNVARNVGGFARENASWLGPAAAAGANYMAGQQAADINAQELELERQKFNRLQSQQDALAKLLNPMFQAQAQRVGTGYRG